LKVANNIFYNEIDVSSEREIDEIQKIYIFNKKIKYIKNLIENYSKLSKVLIAVHPLDLLFINKELYLTEESLELQFKIVYDNICNKKIQKNDLLFLNDLIVELSNLNYKKYRNSKILNVANFEKNFSSILKEIELFFNSLRML